jgi:hypothetical protein
MQYLATSVPADRLTFERDLESARLALKIGLGLAAFLAGLDKFFNVLADWQGYLSPLVATRLPVGASTFMAAVGVIEMAVGLAILTKWTEIGAYVAMVWLLLIALNLVTTGRAVLRRGGARRRDRPRRLRARPPDGSARGDRPHRRRTARGARPGGQRGVSAGRYGGRGSPHPSGREPPPSYISLGR